MSLHMKERRVARATRIVRLYGDLELDEDDDAARVDITVRIRIAFLSRGVPQAHGWLLLRWFFWRCCC